MLGSPPPTVRRLASAAVATGLAVATAVLIAPAAPALAATTTLYAAPSGGDTACSSTQPCSLSAAQARVRTLVGSMTGDIVVQLAGGTYRLTAPLRFTAADSGTNGYRVFWQAAPSAQPVISGARAVTGWTLADSGRNIWRANVGAGIDSRQLYVNGVLATRARTQVNRGDFTASSTGLSFTNGALAYLNNLANKSRVEMESVNSFTDRYVSVQSISGNVITMQQPAWNNNNFGYDTFTSPHRAGPLYLANAYEFLDAPGEWYLDHGTGALYYIPLSGQNMSSVDVELPTPPVPGRCRRHLRRTRPSPHLQRDHLHRHQLARRQQQPGLRRPADRRLHRRQLELAELQLVPQRLPAVRGHPTQLAARCRPRCRCRRPTTSPSATPGSSTSARPPSASATTPTPTPAASGWARATSPSRGRRSPATRPAAIVVGGVQRRRAPPQRPADGQPRHHHQQQPRCTTSASSTAASSRSSRRTSPTRRCRTTRSTTCRTPACPSATAGAANDAGGSNHYADRGLYNYQPRYSTATTASNNRLVGNYVHDVMQQMNDGGCIYTLSANPGAADQRQLLPPHQRLVRDLLRRGLPLLHRPQQRLLGTGTWATANYWVAENMGNLTVTNNWSTNGSTNVTNGDRGNVVTGNVTVTNGNWPSGRAGRDGHRRATEQHGQPAERHDRGRRSRAAVSTCPAQPRPTARRRSSGTATAAPTNGGPTPRASS